MKKIGVLLHLIFFLLVTNTGSAQVSKPPIKVGKKYLNLYVGIVEHEVLSFLPPGAEFYGDYSKVANISVDRETNTLKFEPTKPGVKTLSVHDRKGRKLFEYRLDVKKTALTSVVRQVRALLGDIDGIKVKIVNGKVVLDGLVLLANDFNRIQGVINQFDGQVTSLVEVNPVAQKKIAQLIEREINNPDIEVRAVNQKYVLQGVASDENERTTAEIIAKAYIPDLVQTAGMQSDLLKKRKDPEVINLLRIRGGAPPPPDKIVQLVVHYVELSKRYLRSSAFRWAPSLAEDSNISFQKDGTTAGNGIVAEFSGIISSLLPTLNYAKQHGFARILESSTIVVQDGKPGLVQSQTQIPFLVRQPQGANTTQFANVGINTNITPTIVNPRSDMIQLQLNFDVSALVGTSAAGPQIAQNKVQTTVSVRSGQSAAIGGLIRNSATKNYNPDPSSNAIVNLYASKDFNKNRTQFVVFVTPIIKSSASSGAEKIKRKFRLRE